MLLVARAMADESVRRIVSYSIFGVSMVVLYGASTLYHAHPKPETRRPMQAFDHIAIYYLIAGTYTPITVVGLRGAWGWSILAVVWVFAVAGTVFKAFCLGRFRVLSTALYVVMGWTVIVAVVPLVQTLEAATLLWLLAGGVAYTGGLTFFAWKRLPFNHAIWHLFVLAGTGCHVVAVLRL